MPIPYTFDETNHIVRHAETGDFIPTVTQVMEAQGLSFDFRRFVKPDVLDRRSRIGTDVHFLTDTDDQDGAVPETWLRQETAGYVESWRGFLRLSGFRSSEWSVRMCEEICGYAVSGELDNYGSIGRYPAIIDKKTGASASDSWGTQLAAYEMLRFRSPKIGRLMRAVAHLREDGSPGRLIQYPEISPMDGSHYADTFMFALQNFYFRLRRGYISERDFLES